MNDPAAGFYIFFSVYAKNSYTPYAEDQNGRSSIFLLLIPYCWIHPGNT